MIEPHLAPLEGEEVFDCASHLLYPGLIDAHVHTPDTLLRGLFCDKSLHQWCDESEQGKLQQRLFDYLDESVPSKAFSTLVQYAYLQYLKTGVVCIVETGQADFSCKALERAAQETGIKALVDWYDEKPSAALLSDTLRRGTHLPEEEDLDLAGFNAAKERVSAGQGPLMTHCLETTFRRQEILRKFGLSTVALLAREGMLNANTILFHCIETDEKDKHLLCESQAYVVHCPVSNQLCSEGSMALEQLLEGQARIGLGTDFLTHDIWEVMRTTYRELKMSGHPQRWTAEHVWKLATASPIPQLYQGAIKVGNSAALLFINDSLDLSPLVELPSFSNVAFNTLTYTRGEHIREVMVNGQWVIRDRRSCLLDEKALEKQYRALVAEGFAHVLIQESKRKLD
jgi:5-methylthioadenosine/S-adenosylhomocysteine deaminase